MNDEALRKLCAKKAMEYIKNNTVIGLGAGRNIACLIELLKEKIEKSNFKIKVVTPSENTKNLCIKSKIEVLPTYLVDSVEVAFDGCGEVDENFYASKGGSGVFLREKIIATMAKDYILLIDEGKLKEELSSDISLEVVKDSLGYVVKEVKALSGNPVIRTSNNKDGYLMTDNGNYILDIKFDVIEDFEKLNNRLINIIGVVETSIFTKEITKMIIAGENGARVISKK
ncbi:ribose 5-phosphate isomerase A [Clostridium sp. SHJSY1]|uniref:ribose 5-phosphate isomerase A n=1 Tax=Clostridium sp. SHJSY1 TaxID=2942483 RepID=UPI00287673CF|nr:ribose 5-phosphate isomerase A [Clostridium sp. SHJSY1]MDS0526979.1 ribose 5-phosphate isomerase A [Clostridium sp. SHJSY1]